MNENLDAFNGLNQMIINARRQAVQERASRPANTLNYFRLSW